MPDITMCANATCSLAMRCYRHANSGTKPSYRQSWSTFEGGNDCGSFWERANREAKGHQGGSEQ